MSEGRTIARHGAVLERGRRGESGTPGAQPAEEEPGAEHIAGARRVGCLDGRGGNLEAEWALAVARQDGRALAAPLDDNDGRQVQQGLLVLRRGEPSPRPSLRTAGPGPRSRSTRPAARRPFASSGAVDHIERDERTRLAGEPGRGHAGQPQRLVQQRVGGQVENVGAGGPALGLRSSGRSRSAAPRSWTNERSPPGSTRTPMRPVGAPATRTARTWTPSPVTAATSARPTGSRPMAQTRLLRAPSLPSQRAVVVALPPWRRRTRPGTSVPRSSARSGAATTSTTRSPSTTTAGLSAPRLRRGAAAIRLRPEITGDMRRRIRRRNAALRGGRCSCSPVWPSRVS